MEITETTVDDIRAEMLQRSGQRFAILDSCNEPRVISKVAELDPENAVSLYRGQGAVDYREIAPYLVAIDEPLLDWIIENLWEDAWGILTFAATDINSLRRHFRRFVSVKDPDGNSLFFRFYDPRVLRDYLETCNDGEREEFFGPCDAFYAVVNGQVLCIRKNETS